METLSTAVNRENYLNGNNNHHHIHHSFSSSSASLRHVNYSCGVCGYELNLSSSNRNTSTIGSKYGKSIKRGIISFFYIDESRFSLVDEFQCIPYFLSKSSWGFFRRRTKLLCRKCGNPVGIAYDDESPAAYPLVSGGESDLSSSGTSETPTKHRKYDIKIRSLQPSHVDRVDSTPHYVR